MMGQYAENNESYGQMSGEHSVMFSAFRIQKRGEIMK